MISIFLSHLEFELCLNKLRPVCEIFAGRFPNACLDIALQADPRGDVVTLYDCVNTNCGVDEFARRVLKQEIEKHCEEREER